MSTQPTPFDPNKADAERVRQWMQASLDGYFKQNIGRWAFRPLEQYVDVRDDLAEDLRAIYEDVEPHAQVRWRSATRDLLAMQGRDLAKREATRVLIDFAALVRAHEVLDVLPALVSSDPESLLDQVVETAVALANQTDAARVCLERLYTSPSFSADYAGIVLTALCHVDPSGWLSHVEKLAQPMHVLASRLDDDSTALRFYARSILEAISLSRVGGVNPQRLANAPESAWLWREWVAGPEPLIPYELDAGSIHRRSSRAQPAESLPAIESPFRNPDSTVAVVLVPRGQRTVWVAACQDTSLADLQLLELGHARDWLNNFLEDRMQVSADLLYNALGPDLESLHPTAFAFTLSHGVPSAHQIDPAAYSDSTNLNSTTNRIRFLKKYGSKIEPTDRRVAIRHRHAAEAAACAIDLIAA